MICECSISSLRIRASLASSTFSWANRKQDAARASSKGFIWHLGYPNRGLRAFVEVGEERREDADDGEERADLIYEAEAGSIGERAQEGRADAAHAEREAEEETGDGSYSAGHQFLGIDQDRRKGRGQNQADYGAEDAGPKKVGIGQRQGEREHAEDGAPDDVLAADTVANGAADDGPGGNRAQEDEQMHLRALHGHVKLAHQIKRVERDQARQLEVLRKDQRAQNGQRPGHFSSGQRRMARAVLWLGFRLRQVVALVPG